MITVDTFIKHFRTAAYSLFGNAITVPASSFKYAREFAIGRAETQCVYCDPSELPPRDTCYNMTLVIDIDETMLCARPNYKFYEKSRIVKDGDTIYVLRPLLIEFLCAVKNYLKSCEVVVWTAGSQEHARNAIRLITDNGRYDFFDFVIARGDSWVPDCSKPIVKSCKLLGTIRSDSCILVDNSETSALGFMWRSVIVPSFVPCESPATVKVHKSGDEIENTVTLSGKLDDMTLAYIYSVVAFAAYVINLDEAEMLWARSPHSFSPDTQILKAASPKGIGLGTSSPIPFSSPSSGIIEFVHQVYREYKVTTNPPCPLISYAIARHPFVVHKVYDDDASEIAEMCLFVIDAITVKSDKDCLVEMLRKLERIPISPTECESPLREALMECFKPIVVLPALNVKQISTSSGE